MSEETVQDVRKQSRRMWAAVIVLLVLILANFGFVFARPDSRVQTILGPIGPVGDQGPKGEQGPPPTQEQISQAVYAYCANTNNCEGKAPSLPTVLAAVSQYCSDGRCKGDIGDKGADAPPITNAQVYAAVAQYCSNGQCQGPQGDTGATGGIGPSGREIELRGNDDADTAEWRYVGEVNWHTLTRYCELTNSCAAGGVVD